MALPSPGKYKLLQKERVSERHSLIFVKLTDSAQRALSEYLKNQSTCSITPKIEFNEDTGSIQIPNNFKGIPDSETRMAQFKFNVDSNLAMQGQQGRFECIKRKRNSEKIQKYGPLTTRLRIHASEDVFETTKNRMAEVDLEQRKVCTREIDLNLETVNRYVKVDRNSKSRVSIAVPTPITNVPSSVAIENKLSKLGSQKSTKPRNKPQNNIPKLNSPIAKRPLKERIIHMLAVRPLKKIELSAALRKDGLREIEKAHLYSTLMSVATVKDNVYHLLRHVWNDVQEDWAFYSEQEKQQMRRNKPQNLTPPTSDSGISTSSNLSPRNSSPGDRSPSYHYKRPGYSKGVDGLPTKRVRISHFSRSSSKLVENNENVHQISSSRVTDCFDDIIEKSGLSNTPIKNVFNSKRNPKNTEKPLATKKPREVKTKNIISDSNIYVRNEITVVRDQGNCKVNVKTKVAESQACKETEISVQTLLSNGSNDYSNNFEDGLRYMKEYVTITNTEQRRKYKNDFLMYYKEYRSLNKTLTQVQHDFVQLKNSLGKHEKGSPESSKIENEIVQKYNQMMDVNHFAKMKWRYDYLHEKLAHIKRLVHEYDAKML